jgi:spore germination protein
MLIPFDRKKNDKNVFKYMVLSIAFIGVFYILIVESSISVMGIDLVIQYKDTLLAVVRRIDLPNLQVLRRLDGIFLLIWIMNMFTTILVYAYGCLFLLNKLFKRIRFSVLSSIVFLIAFVVALVPQTKEQIEKMSDYASYIGLVPAIVMPMILFIRMKVGE